MNGFNNKKAVLWLAECVCVMSVTHRDSCVSYNKDYITQKPHPLLSLMSRCDLHVVNQLIEQPFFRVSDQFKYHSIFNLINTLTFALTSSVTPPFSVYYIF